MGVFESARNLSSDLMNMSPKLLQGGGGSVVESGQGLKMLFMQLVIVFIFILIKAGIIFLTYNSAIPSIIRSVDHESEKKFHPIKFSEAVMISILFIGLF